MDRGEWRDLDKDVGRGTWYGTKWVLRALVGIVVLSVAMLVMWTFGWGFFQRSTADFRGETEARERIYADGDYRIQVYNEFHDRCASVQAHEDRLAALEAELALNPPPQRVAIIQASMTGIRAQRAEDIREYNADAAKDFTSANFRDIDLPHRLDPEQERTTCAAE